MISMIKSTQVQTKFSTCYYCNTRIKHGTIVVAHPYQTGYGIGEHKFCQKCGQDFIEKILQEIEKVKGDLILGYY